MIKKSILFFLGMFFLVTIDVKAMMELDEDIKENKTTYSLSKNPFETLPSEKIVDIAEYLYGDDFHNFALTCLSIRNILLENKKFFIPEEESKIRDVIIKTPLENIPNLILKWGRTSKKEAIPRLRIITNKLEGYPKTEDLSETALKSLRKQFKEYIKLLNILYGLGDKEALLLCKKINVQAEVELESTMQYTDMVNFSESVYIKIDKKVD